MSALVCEKPIAADTCPRCGDLAELVQSLRKEVGQLRREVATLRAEVGYWKSRHADAVKRNERLQAELQQARGEIRQLKARLFGRKAERHLAGQDLAKLVEDEGRSPARKRGGQPGHRGHRRIDYSHLPAVEEIRALPIEDRRCERCGKPRLEMTDTEDSEQIEIEVRAHRGAIRRKRYRAACDCPDRPVCVTAPPAPKLIPKGIYGISVWVHLLLDKFFSHRPTARSIEQLRLEGLPLSAGTITAGFERLQLLLEPIYQAFTHQAGTKKFPEHDARLREQLAAMQRRAEEELADTKLRLPCRKVLESLGNHWEGLVRFVDHPEIPMDNNGSERVLRGHALGRRNYYGSGSLWSGRLAATMFSILATLKLWNLNPRAWLIWYFEQCAATGGNPPDDIEPFLPWNLSKEQLAAMSITPAAVPPLDTS